MLPHLGHNHVRTEERLSANFEKKLVGRDGIEPPTPGFSVLNSESWKYAEILALQSGVASIIVRQSVQQRSGMRPSRAHFWHTTPSLSRCLWRDLYDWRPSLIGREPFFRHDPAFLGPRVAGALERARNRPQHVVHYEGFRQHKPDSMPHEFLRI